MASYEAQINLIVGGLRELDRLSDRLRLIEKQIIDVNRLGVRPQERDPATGRFGSDPDRANRAQARRLQEISQREERLANAKRKLLKDQNDELTAQILLQSRLNAATDLYQRKLEELSRGGGGTKLTSELKSQVEEIKRAFDVTTEGGTKNLSLVRSLATELGRVVERQNEINRLSTFQSKAFYKSQEFERQIASLREKGAGTSAFGGVGKQLREYRSAVSRGSQGEAEDIARRIKESLARIARELESALKQAEIESKTTRSAKKAAQSWEQFFEYAASSTLKIKQTQKDATGKLQAFFEDAAAQALNIKQYNKDLANSWKEFFKASEAEADRLRSDRLSKFAALRGNPEAYSTQAGPLPAGRAGGPRYFQEVLDQQKQMLEIEKEIAQTREESIRRTSAEEKKRIQEAAKLKKLYGEIGSSLLDAVSFGKGSDIERVIAQKTQDTIKGLKNSFIRGGLGLGGLGLGKATFATTGAIAAMAQQTASQASGFKGLGMLDPTAALSATNQAIIKTLGSIGAAVNDALGGVPGIVADMLSAIGQIPDSLGLAAVAAFAFAPAIKNVSTGLYNLGKAAGETKIGSAVNQFLTNINPLATAAYGSIEALTNGLDQLRGKALDLQQIATESKNITDQLNNAYGSLPLALPAAGQTSFKGEYSVDPRIGAFTVGGGVRALQKQPIGPDVVNTLQQGYQNAEFLANATGKLAARSNEAAAATLMFAESLGKTTGETEAAKQRIFELAQELADAAAAFERFKLDAYAESANAYSRAILNLDKTFKEYVNSGGRGLDVITSQAEAYDRAAQSAKEYANSIQNMAEFGYKGELPALRPAGYTSQDVRIKNLLDDEKKNAQILTDYEIELERIYRNFQIDEAQKYLVLELDNIDELLARRKQTDDEYWAYATKNWEENSRKLKQPISSMSATERIPSYPSLEGATFDAATLRAQRLQRVKQGRKIQEANKRALSEGLIGGAFPLLFGQGIGAAIGGGAGGTLGGLAGGGLGFGLSLVGTALGTAFDQLAKAAADAGTALRTPIEGFAKLKEANLFASKEQEYYIQKLIESGKVSAASAAIQGEIIKKIGVTGVNDLSSLGKASSDLSKAWAELNLQLQAALAGPLAGLLKLAAQFINLGNNAGRVEAQAKDLIPTDKRGRKLFQDELTKIYNQTYGTKFDSNKGVPRGSIENTIKYLSRDPAGQKALAGLGSKFKAQSVSQNLTLDDIDKARQASEQLADNIRNAYRDGFKIQRQSQDIERSIADDKKKVADEVFQKQQEVAKLEVSNARTVAQIKIDATDLALRKSFAGAEGDAAAILRAVTEEIKVRATGQADIEQKRRELEITLADYQKATSDYMYERAKVKIQLERQIEDYKMDVSDYQLKNQRLIQQEQRNEQALIGSGAAGSLSDAINRIQGAWQFRGTSLQKNMRSGDYLSNPSENYFFDFRRNLIPAAQRRVQTLTQKDIAALAFTILTEAGPTNIGKLDVAANLITRSAGMGNIPIGQVAKQPGQYMGVSGYTKSQLESTAEGQRIFGKKEYNRVVDLITSQNAQMSPIFSNGLTAAQAGNVKIGSQVGYAQPAYQFQQAASQVNPRPTFGNTSIDYTSYNNADKARTQEKLKEFDLQKKINDLNLQNALYNIQEVARGDSNNTALANQLDLEQKRIDLIKSNIGISQNQLDVINKQLEGEKQIDLIQTYSNQAIEKVNNARDKGVMINGKLVKLSKEEADTIINQIVTGTEIRVQNTETALKLEKQILIEQQKNQFNQKLSDIAREAALADIGVKFGYIGKAAEVFREGLDLTGSVEQAKQLADAVQKLQTQPGNKLYGAYNEALSNLQDIATWENVAVTGANAIGDAFGNAFQEITAGTSSAQDILANFFRNIANGFSNLAGQMITDLVKLMLYKPLFNMLGLMAPGAAGGAGAIAGSLLNAGPLGVTIGGFPAAAKGAYFSGDTAMFAKGGMVSSPTLFKFADGGTTKNGVMGEAGPEAILPLSRGSDGKLGVSASGGGSTSVTVNVDASGSKVQGDNQQANQLGKAVASAVQEELLRQKRPGGLLA